MDWEALALWLWLTRPVVWKRAEWFIDQCSSDIACCTISTNKWFSEHQLWKISDIFKSSQQLCSNFFCCWVGHVAIYMYIYLVKCLGIKRAGAKIITSSALLSMLHPENGNALYRLVMWATCRSSSEFCSCRQLCTIAQLSCDFAYQTNYGVELWRWGRRSV